MERHHASSRKTETAQSCAPLPNVPRPPGAAVATTVLSCPPSAVTLDNGARVVHSAPTQRLTCSVCMTCQSWLTKFITCFKPERGEPYDPNNHSAGERQRTH